MTKMSSFGANTLDKQGAMVRTKGIVHTIKDGMVIENARLMDEVAQMVAESKKDSSSDAATLPFTPAPSP